MLPHIADWQQMNANVYCSLVKIFEQKLLLFVHFSFFLMRWRRLEALVQRVDGGAPDSP